MKTAAFFLIHRLWGLDSNVDAKPPSTTWLTCSNQWCKFLEPRSLPLQCCFMCISLCISTHCLALGASMVWQMTLFSALPTLILRCYFDFGFTETMRWPKNRKHMSWSQHFWKATWKELEHVLVLLVVGLLKPYVGKWCNLTTASDYGNIFELGSNHQLALGPVVLSTKCLRYPHQKNQWNACYCILTLPEKNRPWELMLGSDDSFPFAAI